MTDAQLATLLFASPSLLLCLIWIVGLLFVHHSDLSESRAPSRQGSVRRSHPDWDCRDHTGDL
jgi:hypothetical protein